MDTDRVVIKETEPMRLAEARGVAAGLAPQHIGAVFRTLAPPLLDHLQRAGAQPGTLVHYYDEPGGDGSVGVHIGYEIGKQPVPASPGIGIEVVELPVVEVAAFRYRGDIGDIERAYVDLIRWIDESDYRRAGYSRELYHEMGADGPRMTELQIPVAR